MELLDQAKSYACDYISTIQDRRIFPTESAIKNLDFFSENLPRQAADPAKILQDLHKFGSAATVAQTSGRYFGFVCGSIFPVSMAAKWLTDAWDQNPALYVMSPVFAKLEAVCETWLKDVFCLPEQTVCGLVGGTSIATMCGLAAGRNQLLKNHAWDIHENGLFNAPALKIVLGQQAHSSVFKALSLLGFGRSSMTVIPVDEQGRMQIEKLPELDDKTLLLLQAGNVNSGAFDPLDAICDLAQKAKSWVHVDGAFGLWAAGSKNKAHLVKGMDKADSWSVDAHKTLNAPYDCGIILCKHEKALVSAMQAVGSYIQYSEHRDSMLYTPDMSRRGRAVDLWSTMKSLGKNGIENLVDQLCEYARQFAECLKNEGFHIRNDVVFNQVLAACDTPEETQATLDFIQQSGECWCGGAEFHKEPVIRISVCSWETTKADIIRSVDCFVKSRSLARKQ
ncbi:MAG: aminotransferase class V-fold PLP-dependent enzyme [Desulfobacteraceae bacterium]|nr:aminotransferase class V-fold PLP-dependent enzyme [Desulfobacteraceae bacterium]